MPTDQLMTLAEISAYLGLPEETIYKYARHGRIPASKIGRFWRFNAAEVDRWVARHSNRESSGVGVLVVDDDDLMRGLVHRWLTEVGSQVDTADGGLQALEKIKAGTYDIVILDLMMPGMNGVETLRSMRDLGCKSEVVILTSFFESRLMDQALELGPLTLIRKPADKETLQQLIRTYQSLVPSS